MHIVYGAKTITIAIHFDKNNKHLWLVIKCPNENLGIGFHFEVLIV
jgi:hypothetical protein